MGLVGFDAIEESDAIELHGLIEEHAERTGSPVAAAHPRRVGRVPAALQEGHAARLQARAARDARPRSRARDRAAESHRRRGFVTHGAERLMGKVGGFLEIARVEAPERDPAERTADFKEFVETLPVEGLREQGARCMECGVPFCHNGCPLGNLIPDWNDLVYRDRWREAIVQLHATNNFPEFTGRLCPAPCEAACVLEIREGDAVSIKQIEVSIVNRAWDEGWIVPQPPAVETGRTVAVIGAGPGGPGRRAAAAPRGPHGHGLRARRGRRRAGPLRRPALQDREVGRRAAAGSAEGRGREFRVRRRRRRRHLRRGAARRARRGRDRHRLARPARPAGARPRARRRALRDGVPLRPRARARRQPARRTRSPPPASTCWSSAAATPARTASATRTARARRR